MTTLRPSLATVFHETGHAVAHVALDLRFIAVVADEHETRLHTCSPRDLAHAGPPALDLEVARAAIVTDRHVHLWSRDMIARLAGPAARLKYEEWTPAGTLEDLLRAGGGADANVVERCALAIGCFRFENDHDALLEKQRLIGEALIEANRLVVDRWRKIEIVAAALFERQRLTESDVRHLIRG